MINKEIFNESHITLDVNVKNQKDAFWVIAEKFVSAGVSDNVKKCYKGLLHRESEGTTGFNDGIAIPHARISEISKAGVFVFKFTNGVEWNSIDGSKVKIAIALAIPADVTGDLHIKILSSIARKLVDDEFRLKLTKVNTAKEIFDLINQVEII